MLALGGGAGGGASMTAGADVGAIAAFLHTVSAAGANYVMGAWSDRVAERGVLAAVEAPGMRARATRRAGRRRGAPTSDASTARSRSSSRSGARCRRGRRPTRRPRRGGAHVSLPPAESTKVVAYKAHLTVHRSAHKVLARSWLTFSSRKWPRAWEGAQVFCSRCSTTNGSMGCCRTSRTACARTAAAACSGTTRARRSFALAAHGGRVCVSAPSSRAGARRRATGGASRSSRARGMSRSSTSVSITVQRVARYPRKRNDTEVIVVAPHTPGKVPKVDTSDIPTLHAGTLPIFRLIGRDETAVGMPIGRAQQDRLRASRRTFSRSRRRAPHNAGPICSASRRSRARDWARSAGGALGLLVRAQIDRYVRFYLERHSFLERIKPRLAVQRLFQQFYSKCDVVAAPKSRGRRQAARQDRRARREDRLLPARHQHDTLHRREALGLVPPRAHAREPRRHNCAVGRARASRRRARCSTPTQPRRVRPAAARRAAAAASLGRGPHARARGRGRRRRVRRARRPPHARAERGRRCAARAAAVAAAGGGRRAPAQ